MKCNVCGNMISNGSVVCFRCGEVDSTVQSVIKHRKGTKAIVMFPVLVSILCMIFMIIIAEQELSAKKENKIQIQQAIQETGFEWYEVPGGICLSKYLGDTTDVNIPQEILEQKVVAIRNDVFSESEIISVTIPGTLQKIPNNAFEDCENLTKITIQNGCTEIGDSAFENCTALKTIEIPESVKRIGADCFYNCISLEMVVLKEGLEEIGNGAFADCESLCTITIPSTVSTIGSSCFEYAKALSEITLLEGKEDAAIGNNAFESTSLVEVNIPGNYVLLDSFCFQYCRSLEKVVWQKGVQGCSEQAIGTCVFPQHSVEFYGTSTITSINGSLNSLDTVVIYAPENSYLAQYAQENEYDYIVEETK